MIDQDLKDVKFLYSKMGIQKLWVGERGFFDRSEFRHVLRDMFQRPLAAVEAKKIIPKQYRLNFLYNVAKDRYHIEELIDKVRQELQPKMLFLSIHIADEFLWDQIKNIGWRMIVDRTVLLRNKLVMDGMHISYQL